MLTLETDSFSWSADASGYNLTLRSPRAKQICDAVKPKKKYTVEIREYRKKRSLSQNDYYWACLEKFSQAMEMSKAWAHNWMLRRYGQLERYDGKIVYVVLPDTDEAEKKTNEAETYHLKPTSQSRTGKDGKQYRTYMLLRGSSTYNTEEFRHLLDGLLDECKQIGIEVMSLSEQALVGGKR